MRPLHQADGLLPKPRQADIVDAHNLISSQQFVHGPGFAPFFDLQRRKRVCELPPLPE